MPTSRFAEQIAKICGSVIIWSADVTIRISIHEPGPSGAPDTKRRFAVISGSEAVDVCQIAHMVAVNMGEKDLIHPRQGYAHGEVLGHDACSAVEYELVSRQIFVTVPAHLDKDAVA